jgi:hypothetical protein
MTQENGAPDSIELRVLEEGKQPADDSDIRLEPAASTEAYEFLFYFLIFHLDLVVSTR